MRFVLLPCSWLYAFVMLCRNKAFDMGLLRSADAGVPVISVGNLTAGGTGKTPLVELIARYVIGRGERLAIISRGYGRTSRGVRVVSDGRSLLLNAEQGGDEPVQIARKFPQAIVVVGERRVEAARVAVEQLGARVIVMDDGFQHRYLRRKLDIVVVDARNDLSREHVLPAGLRREPMAGLRRAGLMVFSKVDSMDTVELRRSHLSRWFQGPTISSRYMIEGLYRADDDVRVDRETMPSKHVVAFSGIGDHQGFVAGLRDAGFTVSDSLEFPDHHQYTTGDFQCIIAAMERKNAGGCITTEKDITRIRFSDSTGSDFLHHQGIFYIRIAVDILDGERHLLSALSMCNSAEVA